MLSHGFRDQRRWGDDWDANRRFAASGDEVSHMFSVRGLLKSRRYTLKMRRFFQCIKTVVSCEYVSQQARAMVVALCELEQPA